MAQLKVELRAAELGVVVSKPTIPVRYDAILDEKGTLTRVQIKYANGRDPRSKNSIVVKTRTLSNRSERTRARTYTSDEIDAILVYLPSVDKVVKLLPKHFEGKECVYIRIKPSPYSNASEVNALEDLVW